MRILTAAFLLTLFAGNVFSGQIYRVTSKDGDKTMSYDVGFGGGIAFERKTAFDPNSKKFVYLDWERGKPEPKAAGYIWDHRTGEKHALYTFPRVAVPLPIIEGIQDLKVCPFTGDKNFKFKSTAVYD